MSVLIPSQIIIEVNNEVIVLNDELIITYNHTNLPKHYFSFRTHKKIFWKVTQQRYDANTCTLGLEVLDYDNKDFAVLPIKNLNVEIKNLHFKKLDWQKFEPLLYSFTRSQLASVIYNDHPAPPSQYRSKYSVEPSVQPQPEKPKESYPIHISETVQVPFVEASFESGSVSFKVLIEEKEFRLRINNPFIQDKFNFIKGWFCKHFGKETFDTFITGTIIDDKLTEEVVTSNEIAAINQNLIQACTMYAVQDFLNKGQYDKEKKIHPLTGVLIPPGFEKPPFENINPQKLVGQIAYEYKVRNSLQLQYLSEHRLVTATNLGITVEPQFGFIFPFLLPSKKCYVWELLNSNATYIWTFLDPSTTEEEAHTIVETQISIIYEVGRDPYIRSEETRKNLQFNFKRIFHTELSIEDITRWTANIETML